MKKLKGFQPFLIAGASAAIVILVVLLAQLVTPPSPDKDGLTKNSAAYRQAVQDLVFRNQQAEDLAQFAIKHSKNVGLLNVANAWMVLYPGQNAKLKSWIKETYPNVVVGATGQGTFGLQPPQIRNALTPGVGMDARLRRAMQALASKALGIQADAQLSASTLNDAIRETQTQSKLDLGTLNNLKVDPTAK